MTIKSLLRGIAFLPIALIGLVLLLLAKIIKIFGLCMLFEFQSVYEELKNIWLVESGLS